MAIIKLFSRSYSDAEFVQGVRNNNQQIIRALCNHCKRYFDTNYKGVFFVDDFHKDDIFQETFVTFWEILSKGKLYVEDGVMKGMGGKEISVQLTTYFMGIAKNKYREWVRSNAHEMPVSEDEKQDPENATGSLVRLLFYSDNTPVYDNSDDIKIAIITECLSHMPPRCNQIITKFYTEHKTLDIIMRDVPELKSKEALKERKFKCVKSLREMSQSAYNNYLNS